MTTGTYCIIGYWVFLANQSQNFTPSVHCSLMHLLHGTCIIVPLCTCYTPPLGNHFMSLLVQSFWVPVWFVNCVVFFMQCTTDMLAWVRDYSDINFGWPLHYVLWVELNILTLTMWTTTLKQPTVFWDSPLLQSQEVSSYCNWYLCVVSPSLMAHVDSNSSDCTDSYTVLEFTVALSHINMDPPPTGTSSTSLPIRNDCETSTTVAWNMESALPFNSGGLTSTAG